MKYPSLTAIVVGAVITQLIGAITHLFISTTAIGWPMIWFCGTFVGHQGVSYRFSPLGFATDTIFWAFIVLHLIEALKGKRK